MKKLFSGRECCFQMFRITY